MFRLQDIKDIVNGGMLEARMFCQFDRRCRTELKQRHIDFCLPAVHIQFRKLFNEIHPGNPPVLNVVKKRHLLFSESLLISIHFHI